MEVSEYIDGPYEGVTQTPPHLSLKGACYAMEDCLAAIPMGVQPRPPLQWKAQLVASGGTSTGRFVYVPQGSPATDKALLLATVAGHVTPFLFNMADWSPVAVTVDTPSQTYLDSSTPGPHLDLRTLSIEDFTFIANRKVVTAAQTATAPTRPHEALIWSKANDYYRWNNVTVTTLEGPHAGTSYKSAYRASTGGSAADVYGVGTGRVAEGLYDGTVIPDSNGAHTGTTLDTLNSIDGYTVTYDVVLDDSLIYIENSTYDFSLATSDDQGGIALVGIKDSVQRFSDLPAIARDGFVVRIAQEAAGADSDYYVQFNALSTLTSGVWKEIIAPGAPLGVDSTTMPVALEHDEDADTWAITQPTWKGRQTGTAELSPDPGFVGFPINDIKWWKGRLSLIYDDGMVCSSSADPFLFYDTTLATQLDSDPFGFLPPAEVKAFFVAGITFDQRYIILGDRLQGIIRANNAVAAPGQVGIDTLSTVSYDDKAVPLTANHKVYWNATRGAYMAVYELAIDRISGLALPNSVTPQVPKYLPSTLDRAIIFDLDFMAIYGTSGSNKLYIHLFREDENQRVQNHWSRWTFPAGWSLAGMFQIAQTAYYVLLCATDNSLHLFTQDLTTDGNGDASEGRTIRMYLDFMLTEANTSSRVYNAATGLTTVTFTGPPITAAGSGNFQAWVRVGDDDYPEGFQVPIHSITAPHTMVLVGDHSTRALWFGHFYQPSFTPSRFFYKGQDERPVGTARLSVRRVKWTVADYGAAEVLVQIKGRKDQLVTFEGTYLDDVNFNQAVGETGADIPPSSETRTLNTPVGGRAEDIRLTFRSTAPYGWKVTGYEWEGDLFQRARRLT